MKRDFDDTEPGAEDFVMVKMGRLVWALRTSLLMSSIIGMLGGGGGGGECVCACGGPYAVWGWREDMVGV